MTDKHTNDPILDTLEDHSGKIKSIMKTVKSVMDKFNKDKKIGHFNVLTERNVEVMDHILMNCLNVAAELSMTRKDVKDQLSNHYTLTYVKSPAMGNRLFNKHFNSIIKPYDNLKDYIWKSIFILDEYKSKNF